MLLSSTPARSAAVVSRLARLHTHLSATHEVLNQPRALEDYNAFLADPALRHGIDEHHGGWGSPELSELGQAVGSAEWQQKSRDANAHEPKLVTHDRFGHRVDRADFHPAYHELMGLGLRSGAASWAWEPAHRGRPGAHVIRGAMLYLMYQLNPGVCCPITMSFAATPALERQRPEDDDGGVVATLLTKLRTPAYCPEDGPVARKEAVTMGMSMTEKQGGSDVRANTTVATATGGGAGPGSTYVLRGHKWFTSAPMSDAFLTLAQVEGAGVTCFVVPRWDVAREDGGGGGDEATAVGRRNVGFQLQRLKVKMGDKSNASAEVEYREAFGTMLGQPGRGIRTIVDMVTHTRLDCVIGSAALMRLSAQQAAHHCAQREAFGKPLGAQPLMRAVLADLALESEAAVALWFRLAASLDRAPTSTSEAAFSRIGLAVSKYWVCKRAPAFAYEAMECHGGNGYVEEGPMAALYRQAPLNAIWEGSGNVIALDVLRALAKEPESGLALFAELDAASDKAAAFCSGSGSGSNSNSNAYAQTVAHLRKVLLGTPPTRERMAALEPRARWLVDRLAVTLSAATLLLHGDPVVAEAFLATRLPGGGGGVSSALSSTGGGGGGGAAAAAAAAALPVHNVGSLAGELLPEEVIGHLVGRLRLAVR